MLVIDEAAISTAARILRAGGLVAFPTETVYGLGANALDADAVARIFAVKGRPRTSPLIVHVASIEMAQSLVEIWPETAARLAKKFWPGPLTLVLEKSHAGTAPSPAWDGHSCPSSIGRTLCPPAEQSEAAASQTTIPAIVTAGLSTVGLRMPAHPIAQALIRAAHIPVAAPSANRFTHLSPTTADHVRASLGSDVDYILDGGPCHVGIESTVLSLAGPEPVLLRPGGISRPEIEAIIGPISTAAETPSGAHPSPGMHARHYSPRTALLLVRNGEVPAHGNGIYLQYQHRPTRADIALIEMPLAAADYAAALYDTLHRADRAGRDWIAVDEPPETPEWEAIRDRLRRAASN